MLSGYLLFMFLLISIFGGLTLYGIIDFKYEMVKIAMYCFVFGMIGGILHCLRSIYLHRSLIGDWDSRWDVWYFLRPVVSGTVGIISMIFIKAGLLIFTPGIEVESRLMAYLAVAFAAGYNVKNFLIKIEDVSKAILGIEKKEFPEKGGRNHNA
ncbi:MAG: hypothetical protein A3K83_00220 [Omnitrophica WOR_2 bacterium RBG_13_44_8b]|nr:MAG: hypothetical protein A3K83_00220 [Omnitrophica WOR_2 bacterium RBG_13_44_8b]